MQFPIGLQLRIPIHKELLVGGVEVAGAGYGYGAHLGLLFAGRWTNRGFFVTASYDPQHPAIRYYGGGLKISLPYL